MSEESMMRNVLKFKLLMLKDCAEFAKTRFMPAEFAREHGGINIQNYEVVAEGECVSVISDLEAAEWVFRKYNYYRPESYTGRSMSVSDIVIFETPWGKRTAYYCDSVGFEPLTNEEAGI